MPDVTDRKCETCRFAVWDAPPDDWQGDCTCPAPNVSADGPLPRTVHVFVRRTKFVREDRTTYICPTWQAKDPK